MDDIAKEIKKKAIIPILKKNNYTKDGKAWIKVLDSGILLVIEISVNAIIKNNFSLTIYYGIDFQGIMELCYGFPYNTKHGIGDCIFKDKIRNEEIQQYWNSSDFSEINSFKESVSYSLENMILPSIESITDGAQLLGLFSDDVTGYIKRDSIFGLKISCLCFLLGDKERGIKIVKQIISSSNLKYEFAENVLYRMENFSVSAESP